MRIPRGPTTLILAATLFGLGAARQSLARVGDPLEDLDERGPARIYAVASPNLFLHNAGPLTLQITNMGILGNPYNNDLSAGWRGNEYLGQACLMVGAIGGDNDPHVSASIAGTRKLEFRPSRDPVDTIYPSYEGRPGGNRPGFFDADDDGDGTADEEFHNGKDDDGDGRIDEDFAAIGQQMFSCEYRDDTPEAGQISDHVPLGIKVRQRSFQWSEPGTNEFVGFDFAVVNVGDQTLKDVYIGLFVDGDIGPKDNPAYFEDDLAGVTPIGGSVFNPMKNDYYDDALGRRVYCRTTAVSATLAYMWDSPDELSGAFGDAPGYLGVAWLGDDPDRDDPCQGCRPPKYETPRPVPVLQTVSWTSSAAPYPDGDPRTDDEKYDLLSSGSRPHTSRAAVPGDYRMTISAGSYGDLEPGDQVHFEAALGVGNGLSGLSATMRNAAMVYEGLRFDIDRDPETGVDGKERCLAVLHPPGLVYWKDPCQDTMLVEVNWTEPSCYYVDDDCDPCTGRLGREHRIKWMGFTTPPNPDLNTDPAAAAQKLTNPETQIYFEPPGGDRRVVLQWDNVSELRPDPVRGVNVFEGYRIYRVDDWDRPSGSLGPSLSDWKILAEFRSHPRDGLGVRSPYHLRRVERPERDEVKAMTPYGPLYHVGRYEWADTAGIVNGKVYFYAVTAFSVDQRLDPNTGQLEEVIVDGLPSAEQRKLVMPSWGPGEDCGDVKVVPNPYRGGADWDIGPSDCDATGTRIAFRNLPPDWKRLDIFTLSGDLVFSGRPGESRVIGGCEVSPAQRSGGTFYWDLVTRSGQDAVSGIYLLVIDRGGSVCRRHFVIMR